MSLRLGKLRVAGASPPNCCCCAAVVNLRQSSTSLPSTMNSFQRRVQTLSRSWSSFHMLASIHTVQHNYQPVGSILYAMGIHVSCPKMNSPPSCIVTKSSAKISTRQVDRCSQSFGEGVPTQINLMSSRRLVSVSIYDSSIQPSFLCF